MHDNGRNDNTNCKHAFHNARCHLDITHCSLVSWCRAPIHNRMLPATVAPQQSSQIKHTPGSTTTDRGQVQACHAVELQFFFLKKKKNELQCSAMLCSYVLRKQQHASSVEGAIAQYLKTAANSLQ